MKMDMIAETRPREADAEAEALDAAVAEAARALAALRREDGHFVFELEADATIPAEYVLFTHYLGETPDPELERKIGVYLRRRQAEHGGWPLFHGGPLDVSATVKAYFALKMIGDDAGAPHMARAREAVLAAGGAEEANVFTRILLALYGVTPWESAPAMPVQIVLAPPWFPFNIWKISYWARTVLVPLLVLMALRPTARNPRGVRIDELFRGDPRAVGPKARAPHQNATWHAIFRAIDVAVRRAEPMLPDSTRGKAVETAVAFVRERLNGEDGLGAIFPAMANAVMMFDALGYPSEHPDRAQARRAVDGLLVVKEDEAYCQPCVSPVWDTALAAHALLEAGDAASLAAAGEGLDWLAPRQVTEIVGDWGAKRPDAPPGGWAFQYANPHYPDLDDTAVIVAAMERLDRERGGDAYAARTARARAWILGMQSEDGGWGAFDADNDAEHLNSIPFADHGALLDPSTPDLTGRCLSMLAQLGEPASSPAVKAGRDFLMRAQRPDGAWFGRWGVNLIYGTWSALSGLNAIGVDPEARAMRRGAAWLASIQNTDGGWGEGCASYELDYRAHRPAPSAPTQTAWAMIGLMAAGEARSEAVARGAAWLLAARGEDGLWSEAPYNGTGFPRVFYLRYHGYAKYFPLWALARRRALLRTNSGRVGHGL